MVCPWWCGWSSAAGPPSRGGPAGIQQPGWPLLPQQAWRLRSLRKALDAAIRNLAAKAVDAPADTVYRYVGDMREQHPRYLPPAFSDFRVGSGGVGAGTISVPSTAGMHQ
jgi:hypothetical protein